MHTNQRRRLETLESAINTTESGFTPEALLDRVAILEAEGRAQDQRRTEFGGLFSPDQLSRMATELKGGNR